MIIEFFLQHRKNKSVVAIIPKLREALEKIYQSVSALLSLANIPASMIHLGTLKNYDVNEQEIWSQNTHASSSNGSNVVSDEDDDMNVDDDMMNVSEDATVGNLNVTTMNDSEQQTSIRSRSTIL